MKKAIENLVRGVVLSGALATGASACTNESVLCGSFSSKFGVRSPLDTQVSGYRCESKDKTVLFAEMHYTKPKERTVCISIQNNQVYTDDNCDGITETDNPYFKTDVYVLLAKSWEEHFALCSLSLCYPKTIKEIMAKDSGSYAKEYFTR